RRRIGLGVKARERQPLADRGAHIRLVIHDRHFHRACHIRPHSAACLASPRIGSCISKTAPPITPSCGSPLWAVSRPPRSVTIPDEIARPSPTPSPGFFVV